MTKRANPGILAHVALLALGTTCALGCVNYDELVTGEDVKAAAQRQIQNPERSEERTVVDGIGATTAADVTTNYHANQTTDAQQQRQDAQRDNVLNNVR